jgi:hypothetical protein
VCLTVVGLLRVVDLRAVATFADDALTLNAVMFLVSCMTSYRSLRSRVPSRRRSLERVADATFMAAIVFMTGIAGLVTYEVL